MKTEEEAKGKKKETEQRRRGEEEDRWSEGAHKLLGGTDEYVVRVRWAGGVGHSHSQSQPHRFIFFIFYFCKKSHQFRIFCGTIMISFCAVAWVN